MAIEVIRTEAEIHDVAVWAEEHSDHGTSEHSDATYEMGVLDALRWATGAVDARPDIG